MAQSEREKLLARIDADMARLSDMRGFCSKHDNPVEQIDREMVDLKRVREYVTTENDANSSEPQPKKRGRRKKGLPSAEDEVKL